MTAVELMCAACGTGLPPKAKFCSECGTAVSTTATPAEYKQVTVLFADVVHSMDIAAAVGAERLREIMTELVERASSVVQRYGGTVDKFTGDGIMALFGAPVALEDHAIRACLAALDIQIDTEHLAAAVEQRDEIMLRLRVGLNSGQVIAGEIGPGPSGYTAIGEQVGMAQRMESVAPPGGVMLAESTARLIENAAVLGEPEMVHIKGADDPVPARRLVTMAAERERIERTEPTLVGRTWELNTITGILDEATSGAGCVVSVVGPPGIGKSRMVREAAALAVRCGVDVFTAHCESHATAIPFHVVARLLRAGFQVDLLDEAAARAHLRTQVPDADPEDLMLLEDMLGIGDPDAVLPRIEAEARRRRLTALINAALLAREDPALYVIEDAHWIDEVSESMLADFLPVIPQTRSLVLVTYRPEYEGLLAKVAGSQSITLRPLSDVHTSALIGELLGTDSGTGELAGRIVGSAAGNPFFAEEIVRDLAERHVLHGRHGGYTLRGDVADVTVPATLQATIAARIDRLDATAKRTLNAAAVIGSRFSADLLVSLGIEPNLDELRRAELVDQVRFTSPAEYTFRHPLIRTVAYESQLQSDRAEMHRRLAAAIEARYPESVDANAALIAEHVEAAGDLHAAYAWHMRAGAWSTTRDILAARIGWERARQIADTLPADDPNGLAMRIAPRTLLCISAFRVHEAVAGARFDELRELCAAAGDKASLAIGMAALANEHMWRGRVREASAMASEVFALAESTGDAALVVGLSFALLVVKQESGEWSEVLRWSNTAIDLADGDPEKGNFIIGSPLALALASRGIARWALGRPGWRDDFDHALTMARTTDALSHAVVSIYTYGVAIAGGVLIADHTALREIGDALRTAERLGDDFALGLAREAMGLLLVHRDSRADRERGLELLTQVRDMALQGWSPLTELPVVEVYAAREQARREDRDGAIAQMRAAVDQLVDAGQSLGWGIAATGVLVETLLDCGNEGDAEEAEAAIDRLATVPGDESAYREIWLLRLRALLARVRGDEVAYRELVNRYRMMATSLGYQGHIAWAEAMT